MFLRITTMDHSSDRDNIEVSQAIQENLRQLSEQLGQPQDAATIAYLYESAQELLDHLSPDPLTVGRVAGVLLVYQLPDTDPNEAKWFKSELRACQDNESVEELIDSIFRPDAL
jgi:hypothetical protein